MHVSHVSQMCLFHTAIKDNNIIISYHPPKGSSEKAPPELTIPLKPNCKDLKTVDVTMHGSPSVAYNMGPKCNEWFSSIFGYEVILANWGGNARSVLGNLPNRPASEGPSSKSPLMKALGNIPLIGSLLGGPEDEFIAFNDCAPFLVTTEESKAAVSTRFAPGVEMDMKLFRPNIVLTGSPSEWDEDYWGELSITSAASPGNKAKIILTANCARCASLTVDYETGKHGTGPTGDALKVLMKDRRVDPGSKWSPIFGRYGFLRTADDGKVLNVEDKVLVSKRLNQRTIFREYCVPPIRIMDRRLLTILFRLARPFYCLRHETMSFNQDLKEQAEFPDIVCN